MNPDENHLQVVDDLRGFAIVSIMLLHNIGHFDFLYSPADLPAWKVYFDKGFTGTMYFLFGGKAYEIFALLFGLTFFIQSDNRYCAGGATGILQRLVYEAPQEGSVCNCLAQCHLDRI